MTLSERELQTVQAVFNDCLMRFTDDDLHTFIGSETLKDMKNLYSKIRYRDYCERHNIKFEDMTEEDFMRAYFDMNEI